MILLLFMSLRLMKRSSVIINFILDVSQLLDQELEEGDNQRVTSIIQDGQLHQLCPTFNNMLLSTLGSMMIFRNSGTTRWKKQNAEIPTLSMMRSTVQMSCFQLIHIIHLVSSVLKNFKDSFAQLLENQVD